MQRDRIIVPSRLGDPCKHDSSERRARLGNSKLFSTGRMSVSARRIGSVNMGELYGLDSDIHRSTRAAQLLCLRHSRSSSSSKPPFKRHIRFNLHLDLEMKPKSSFWKPCVTADSYSISMKMSVKAGDVSILRSGLQV